MKKVFNISVSKYSKEKSFSVYRPSSLDNPLSNSVMFVMAKYISKAKVLSQVKDCLVFWPTEYEVPDELRAVHVFVKSKAPRKDYNRFFIENSIQSYPQNASFEIVSGAYICHGAKIGEQCTIMPGSYIGNEVTMGSNVYIGSGARLVGPIYIADNVVIRENTVIGADGLTTDRDEEGNALTMPQFGGVVIESNVQIGANVVIGRGAIDNTIIRKGSKIDSCCFISHNVEIGENVFIVGETILMGSSKVKKNSYISGNVTIRNKTNIEENAFIGMGAVVTKDVKKGTVVFGNPAKGREEQ